MRKILPILIVLLLVFSGCLKRKESFLVGRWEDIPRNAEPAVLNVWAFKDNNTFVIEVFPYEEDGSIGELDRTITGEYTLKKKNVSEFRLTIDIPNENNNYIAHGNPMRISGEYWIDELDRDMLKMTREKHDEPGTPFLRLEMIRL